jgi:hypothetical protein
MYEYAPLSASSSWKVSALHDEQADEASNWKESANLGLVQTKMVCCPEMLRRRFCCLLWVVGEEAWKHRRTVERIRRPTVPPVNAPVSAPAGQDARVMDTAAKHETKKKQNLIPAQVAEVLTWPNPRLGQRT